MVDLIDFLDEFQGACGALETFKRSRSFMAAYLRLMEKALPTWGREGLAMLDLLNRGEATVDQVDGARVKCWQVLVTQDFVMSEAEKCAARALTCCLYSELPSGIDVPTLVSDFVREANKVEDHSGEIDFLISQFFSGCD